MRNPDIYRDHTTSAHAAFEDVLTQLIRYHMCDALDSVNSLLVTLSQETLTKLHRQCDMEILHHAHLAKEYSAIQKQVANTLKCIKSVE